MLGSKVCLKPINFRNLKKSVENHFIRCRFVTLFPITCFYRNFFVLTYVTGNVLPHKHKTLIAICYLESTIRKCTQRMINKISSTLPKNRNQNNPSCTCTTRKNRTNKSMTHYMVLSIVQCAIHKSVNRHNHRIM